jgi:hypothetical protein
MLAQALLERGALDALIAGVGLLRVGIVQSAQDGSLFIWLAGGALVFLVIGRLRR